jgi:hypothetical protein
MNDEIEVTPQSEKDLRQATLSSIKRKREFTQHVITPGRSSEALCVRFRPPCISARAISR